jgi:hypothetical protein
MGQAKRKETAQEAGETNKVHGKVLSNDGDVALVQFPNGDERFFHRHNEHEKAEFLEMFPTNGPMKFTFRQTRVPDVVDRDSLFEAFSLFSTVGKASVASINDTKSGQSILIGTFCEFDGVRVFCAPDGELPFREANEEGLRGFAVETDEGMDWFELNQGGLEQALIEKDRVVVRRQGGIHGPN